MKAFMKFFTLSIWGTAFLSSCISIDEARVFQPQPVPKVATTPEEMMIAWEEVFTEPGEYTFTNGINRDRSTIQVTKETFIAAEITHDFWADKTIAITEFTTSEPDRPLVLHCGGNASDRYNFGTFFGLKVLPYADVILFDYPGYGDSPGKPSAETFEVMLENLAEKMNARHLQEERPLILWGYSLGGFVCSQLASKLNHVDAIIIEASANNAKSAARQLVPKLLRPFVGIRLSPSLQAYDNANALKGYDGEILVLAGTKDGLLSVDLSRKLAAGLKENGNSVTYYEFADGNHSNLATLEEYQEKMRVYFEKW